jgi:3-hydroxyacyl-[acyl-carrier-protein] dehydratase
MPPQPFVDLESLDLNNVVADRDEIYSILPHRYEFMRLDRICLLDEEAGVMAGYVDLQDDDFWVRGHIPGRPLFPGVMMIETAAQLVSYYTMKQAPGEGFLGFGGVDGVKFRGSVAPGQRVVMLGKMVEMRRRRCIGDTQAFVDGRMVYEGTITGMWL